MRQRPITYTNKPKGVAKKVDFWMLKVVLIIIAFLLLNNIFLQAEGTSTIAPSNDDAAALFIGAGNTGPTGGDYGQFAWKGSNSKLYFNIQNTCEKVYFGFSAPNKDRSFQELNPNSGGTFLDNSIIFRIIDPNGRPINNISCFGNTTINGEVWQTLRPSDANLSNRQMTDIGPSQLTAGGYQAFELDLSACGLTFTGDYSIEFYTRNANYDPNTVTSGFYIEYFDVTVANCSNRPVNGRLWSNNWGFGIKKDGDGPFDRAFNGAFYICSKEGFITKIDFNTNTNNRVESGKNNDQRSGFRAGSFNVSFNTSGPNKTGDITIDRQSVFAQNAPNPELAVFLNIPDTSFCPPQAIGDFKSQSKFITGCPNDYCLNLAFSKPGQIEVLIEAIGGNRLLDHPTEIRLVKEVTEANRSRSPEDPNYPYEVCLPWSGRDGYGNITDLNNAFISGFYYQGIYHFPVYDAEFNDDGFTVATVRPNLGVQELFYDDTQIPSSNFTGESKDGTNGCVAPCHRWTGEYENFQDRTQVFGNFNTINTWWFGNATFKDFSFQVAPKPTLVCPPNYIGCPGDDIRPNAIGNAEVSTANPACTVIEYEDRVLSENVGCLGSIFIERKWSVSLQGLDGEENVCYQLITLEDKTGPELFGVPANETVNCGFIPTPPNNVFASDNCNLLSELTIAFKEEQISGNCGGNYQLRRTWTATDKCGNSTSSSQLVTVVDNIAPTLIGTPTDTTVICTAVPNPPNNVIASDNCENSSNIQISFSEEKIDGACAGNYTLRRTWTATDPCGNQSQQSQKITIIDNTAPTLVGVPVDETVDCHVISAPAEGVTATDNCSAAPVISIEFSEEKIAGNCAGNFTLIRTWTATDDCGNQTEQTRTVTVEDTEGPTLVGVPTDVTVGCDAVPAAPKVTATDNCEAEEDITIIYKALQLDGDCSGNYLLKRAWTATDACGNISLGEQTITIEDNTAPVFEFCPKDMVVFAEDDCNSAVLDLTIPAVSDNCDENVEVASSIDLTAPFPMGTTAVIFTAVDDCGNKTTCEFFVRVENALQDHCPDDIHATADCVEGAQTAIISWIPPNGNECCSACPTNTNIQGFIYLGERGGHRYYFAQNAENWTTASTISDDLGGYLVSISDPAENNFLSDFLVNESIHIGITDNGELGNFYWQNDELLNYQNWNENAVINNPESTQFGQLLADGTWGVTDGIKAARFIVEIPCADVIQLEGPMNGSAFPIGTTRIAYLIDYDNCTNPDTCSFKVTVDTCEIVALEQYCETRAIDTTCFWIDEVSIGGAVNTSAIDGGYGDFTQSPINIYRGFQQTLILNPGYALGHTFNVYWRVWIDYDQNGYFDDPELIFTTKSYQPIEVKYTIPATAKSGHTRMRIVMNFVDDNDPCAELVFGEVEDYLLNITNSDENIGHESGGTTRSRNSISTTFRLLENKALTPPVLGFTPMDMVAARKGTMTLFPNPVSTELTLQIDKTLTVNQPIGTIKQVRIFNQLGQIVYQSAVLIEALTTIQIDVAHLDKGIYFIQIGQDAIKTMKHKFVKL